MREGGGCVFVYIGVEGDVQYMGILDIRNSSNTVYHYRRKVYTHNMLAPSRQQILALYKQYIKYSNAFNNYNYREYFLRRSRDMFREDKLQSASPEQLAKLYQDAKADLGMLKRQAIISQMYTFDKLVVEPAESATEKAV